MSGYFEPSKPKALEPGPYPAKLVAIEDVEVEPFKDPEGESTDSGLRWAFDWDFVTDEGIVRMRQLTTRKLSDFPSTAWRVLEALGYEGGKVARDEFLGKSCMITLGVKKSGWNSWDAFSPIRTKQAPPLNLTAEFPDLKAPEGSAQAMIDRLAGEKAAREAAAQQPTFDDLPPVDLD